MGSDQDQIRALVIGGGGFLGRYIVKRLLAKGDFVRVLSRRSYPDLGVMESVHGDIRDPEVVMDSCRDIDVVFHMAAKIGHWGKWRDFYDTNVKGTENVIKACDFHGVGRLIYTSSASVIFDHSDLSSVDESYPYPSKYDSHYAATKAKAEQLVIVANEGDHLRTVALRPHLIWGPGDTHLIPGIVDSARKGRLAMIGNKRNMVDFTYVENVADAHLLACDQLLKSPDVAGQVYFITQDEPIHLWEFVNDLLEGFDLPPVNRRVSTKMAYALAGISEVIYRKLSLKGEPRLTRFLAGQLACSHHFDISKAKRDLGYFPKVSMKEGMKRLLDYVQKNPT